MFKKNWSLKCIVLLVMLGSLPSVVWAGTSIGCNDNFVTLADNELVIDIAPTGGNDTGNIQCALDTAAAIGIPVVRLGQADYFITSISVTEFKGSFQGTTRANSVLYIFQQGINCTAMSNNGLTPAAIKFIRGEPRLRFMTVVADHPCISGDSLSSLVHFTGKNAFDASCKNDVIFGSVDRVDLIGFDRDRVNTAVFAGPEGTLLGGCKNTLLGTFKLNQSSVSGFTFGIHTSMRAGAQVDINFTTFSDNTVGIALIDTGQSTTITSNTIVSANNDPAIDSSTGIVIGTFGPSPPTKTRVVINNNNFTIHDSVGNFGTGIAAGFFNGSVQDVSMVVSNNQFSLAGQSVAGILGFDIDNVAISANAFSGFCEFGILAMTNARSAMSDWTITANTGFSGLNSSGGDLFLGTNTRNFIVGPSQGITYYDFGSGNTILSKPISGGVTSVGQSEQKNTGANDGRSDMLSLLSILKSQLSKLRGDGSPVADS